MATAMAMHGLLLATAGYYTSSVFGLGAGAAIVACAGLSVSGSFPAYMAGVHFALLLEGGSAALFGVQAARCGLASLQGAKYCASASNGLIKAAMGASSVAALDAMKRFKPKKAAA